MADKTPAYPLRIELPASRPADGQTMGRVARSGAVAGAKAAPREMARQMAPVLSAVVPLLKAAWDNPGTKNFFAGLGGGETSVAAAPTLAAAGNAPGAPTSAPQGLDKIIAPMITPQDRQMALIDAILQHPNTLRQATTAVGMLPAPHYQSQKDISGDQADQLNTGMLNVQLADIANQKKGGAITDAQAQEAADKATNAFFQRRAMTWGFNPLNNAVANLVDQQNPGG